MLMDNPSTTAFYDAKLQQRGRMNVLSLCAGVGGLDLGVELATGRTSCTVCYVEREAHAAAVLVARMEETLLAPAAVWSDLTTFDGTEWRGVVDIVVAGYPCQPFSTAGKRAGTDDPRHLWPHVARIIRECGPGLVFLENVPGHLSLGFDAVCGELQGMGYRVAAGVFSAAEVGASHRRERLFILGHRDNKRPVGEREIRDGERTALRHHANGRYAGMENADGERGCCGKAGCEDAAADKAAERGVGCWPPGPNEDWSGIPEQFWPATFEPGIRGVADGMAARVDRLRACGNGVVPLAAAHAFRTLTAALAGCVTDDKLTREEYNAAQEND